MPKIQLYYSPGGCSLVPHILLRELDVEFQLISSQMTATGAKFPEGFERLNPKMRVPVLVLDKDVITEVPAIAVAIAGLAPELNLMGSTAMETVRVHEWMVWLAGTLHAVAVGCVLRPQRFSDDPAAFESIKAKGLKVVSDCFDQIEAKLRGPYAVGSALTAVEPYLFVFYRWGNHFGLRMKERYPKYTALVVNLVNRSSVQAVLKVEDISSTLE